MQQDVRYCDTPGGRIAYAALGSGPPLVLPTWWTSHLEQDWAAPRFRAFLEPLAAHHTVVRYDRLGVGLSARRRPAATLTLEAELATMDALADHLGLRRFGVLGISCGGALGVAYAGARPERVSRLAVVNGYADGERLASREIRESLTGVVRAHWGLGSTLLSEIFVGEADESARRQFAAVQRDACDAHVASDLLALVYRLDVRREAAGVRAPTLVVHRRGDKAVPFANGVQVAELIPGARLLPIDGRSHVPWYAGEGEVLDALSPFLGLQRPGAAGPKPMVGPVLEDLSAREVEVLRLVADGLSDADIAARLVLSPHTVHRHVANIRAKLRQPSRAAAVAHAAKVGVL